MYAVNRSAVTIRPKQPFVDWINSTPGDDKYTIQQLSRERTVILLPEFQRPGDEMKHLKKICSEIFEHELFAWYMDDSTFPKKRDWKLFQEWFEIELSSEVSDMVDEDVEKDEI